MNTLGDKLMELSAIYHRPESEYAYLYKDKKLHIRIRTKKGDIESINLHYGDPFIFMEEFYQDTKEMVKITSGTLFDHWQVEVSVDFARIQYLFELRDTEGQNILYGDKGCVENSLENLHAIGNGFKLPYLHEIDACKVPDWVSNTVWYQIFPERFANGNALLNPEGTLDWDSSVTPKSDDFFGGDLQGIIDHMDYLQDLGITGLYLCPIFESTSNHKYNTTDYFEIDRHFGDKETFRELVDQAHHRGMKVMLDAVFNHIGSQSLQWKNVVKNGEQSAYNVFINVDINFLFSWKGLSDSEIEFNDIKNDIIYDSKIKINTLDKVMNFIHICCHLYNEARYFALNRSFLGGDPREIQLSRVFEIALILKDLKQEEFNSVVYSSRKLNCDNKVFASIGVTKQLLELNLSILDNYTEELKVKDEFNSYIDKDQKVKYWPISIEDRVFDLKLKVKTCDKIFIN